jgi:hypothetical protein
MPGTPINFANTGYITYGLPHMLPHQSAAITALVAHFNRREPVEVYAVDYNIVVARWVAPNGEETLVSLGVLGQFIRVGYSILTPSDRRRGITDAEWYDCSDLDDLWMELLEVVVAAGIPRPRSRPVRRTRRAA